MSLSSQYVTKQSFGGQRASIGRTVVCQLDGTLTVGIIVAIGQAEDRPIIETIGGIRYRGWFDFFPAGTIEDLDGGMPPSSWTWPPRT